MRDARVTFAWADGDYSFRLGWGELAELQEHCNAGPYVVLNRLHVGEWRIEDIGEVIRLGLIGGGTEPAKALTLTRRYVEGRPPFENHKFAVVILQAGLLGAPEEGVGEGVAANQTTAPSTTFPTGRSDLPPSTEQALS